MNIQSIRNKIDDIQGFVINNDCDLLLLTETWLVENETFLFQIDNYKAIHSCRLASRGGGAAIYIREGIKFGEIEKSQANDIINWVCIWVGNEQLKVSVIYKPPLFNNVEFLSRMEQILLKHPKKHLLVGDFNINLLHNNDITNNYINLLTLNNFKIYNKINLNNATRVTDHSKSIIDHAIADKNCNLELTVNVENNPLSDHNRLSVVIKNKVKIYKPKIKHQINLVDHRKFKILFNQKVTDAHIGSFRELTDLIRVCKIESEYVKLIKSRENNTWMNLEVLEMMKQRDKIYERKVGNPNDELLKDQFKTIKNKINNKIKSLKNQYFQNKWREAGSNVKKQWKFINDFVKNKKEDCHIETLKVDNLVIKDLNEIVSSLNKHFAEVGENIVKGIDNEIGQLQNDFRKEEIICENSLFLELTNEGEIDEVMLGLKRNSAPGHDQVTTLDINNLKPDLVPILTKLVNNIFISGIFPQELKISKITPIYKSGQKENMNNYRPISVISVFSKIIEKLLKKRMLAFIDKYIVVDEYQYGFVKNSSTLSAAVDLVNFISRALDRKEMAVAVFIDLRKAFDVVSLDILLDKLQKMGFRGVIFNLIKSYLCNREQYVSYNNFSSGLLSNSCGVPQGSVLGPLLYSLYVLNLRCANLKTRYFTFADDTVLVYTGCNEQMLNQEINDDLRVYVHWLLSNKIKINIDKTKYMKFKQKNKVIGRIDISIDGLNLEEALVMNYLGLSIDNNLNWSEHVKKISNKILPMISAIFKCRHYLTRKTKESVYNAFFLSHFRYLLPVWGMCNQTNFHAAQVLQNKILKILYDYDRLTHTEILYRELGISQLTKIMELEQCKLMFKIIHKQQKCNTNILFSHNVHNYETRIQNNIYQIVTKSNIGLNNPITDASKCYNRLPDNLKNIHSFKSFVSKLKRHLGIH